jgi:hypothetical protein
MKRFLFLLVIVFSPIYSSFAQVALTFDAALNSLLAGTWVEQAIYYGQIVKNGADSIIQFEQMIEKTGKQVEMAVQNLSSLGDVSNWNDFKDWYNRQLYLEHMAIDAVKGMDVTIGKKNYSMWDLEGIADGLNDTYGPGYWEKEFTEEQRREMWIGMGLTPANYAYVQPYRQKAREISREMLAMSKIQNIKNQAYSYEVQRYIDAIKADAKNKPEDQMGEKAYLQIQTGSLFRIEQELMDISSNQAKQMEAMGVNDALERTPDSRPPMADWSNKGFEEF